MSNEHADERASAASNGGTEDGRFTVAVAELAHSAGVVPQTIRNAIRAGTLNAEKSDGGRGGGEWMIEESSAAAWLRKRAEREAEADAASDEYRTLTRLYKARRIGAWIALGELATEALQIYQGITAGRRDPSEAAALDASVESSLREVADLYASARLFRSELNEAYTNAVEKRNEAAAADAAERADTREAIAAFEAELEKATT